MKTNINGLCKITYKGETFYAAKGISINTECVYSTISSSIVGAVQRVCRNLITEITFTPVFEWSDRRFETLSLISQPVVVRESFTRSGESLL